MSDNMIHITEHNPLDIIRILLPVIPSIISICLAFQKRIPKAETKPSAGYEILLILVGFIIFPDNKYVGMTIGAFVCCMIGLNYKRICKGKPFGGLIFPSIFFFNLTTFSGVNTFENIIMIVYASVGGLYLVGLIDDKEDIDKFFLIRRERLCLIISAISFVTYKFVFLFFTNTLLVQ